MKKILVLTLVLGIASLASAALDLGDIDGVSYSVGAGNVATITVSKDIVGLLWNLKPDAGSLAAVDLTFSGDFGVTSAGAWNGTEGLMDGISASTTVPFQGTILTVDFDDSATKAELVNYYYADSNITWTTADGGKVFITGYEMTLIPEPMTMGLLGLGGLFLARRKK